MQFKSVLATQNISFSKEGSLASGFLIEKGKSNEPLLQIPRENLKMEELNILAYWHKGLLQEFTETEGNKVSICKVQYFLAGKSSSISYFHTYISVFCGNAGYPTAQDTCESGISSLYA